MDNGRGNVDVNVVDGCDLALDLDGRLSRCLDVREARFTARLGLDSGALGTNFAAREHRHVLDGTLSPLSS